MSLLPFQFIRDFFPLMSYCLVMSGTPGPNNIMLATTGANFGFRGAMPAILGIQVGCAILTVITCVGLGNVFIAYPWTQDTLRITGAFYLIYLAWKLSGASIHDVRNLEPVRFHQAAIFQALNPKSWLKAITLASVFMPANMHPVVAAMLLALISTVIGTPCSVTWALFGVSIRHILQVQSKRQFFNFLMGGTLVVLAILFLR